MIKFELVTLNGKKFDQMVHEVILPTPEGYIAVFENHAPLISLSTPGVISIRHQAGDKDSRMEIFSTNGGVIEIVENENTVRLLADEADQAEEINEDEVKKALEAAKKLKSEAKDRVSIDHAQSLIDRESTRLKVAEIRRRHRKI